MERYRVYGKIARDFEVIIHETKKQIILTIKIASTTTDEAMIIYPYIRFCFVSLSCMSIESVPCWAPGPPIPLID